MTLATSNRIAPVSELVTRVSTLDWDCHDAATRHLTHGIHRYSGKFIPQIARQMIELLSRPHELVLDPLCGSGTTLLEAALAGRRAIGIDLNPLAILISKAKCTPVSKRTAETELRRLWSALPEMEGASRNDQLALGLHPRPSRCDDPRLTDPWYTKWFQKPVLEQLVAIHRLLLCISSEALRTLGLIAFSDVLRKCSNANGSYPNVMFDRSVSSRPLPVRPFLQRLQDVCAMADELDRAIKDKRSWHVPRVMLADSRVMPLPDGSVDAIVTHPPYIGSVPYAEYQQLSLRWLGHDPKSLDSRLTGGRRQAPDVVKRFRRDLERILSEARRVLKPGRMLGMLVGNPLVRGRRVDLVEMTLDCAARCRFCVVATQRRRGVNRRANKMEEETLLFLTKPAVKKEASPL